MKYDRTDLENEKKLAERAGHDPDSFGKLYELHYDQILNYILRRTANVQVAQDITAETFFKAYKNIHKFKWQNVPFSAWLYRIAINEMNAWHRKGYYRSASLDSLSEKGFEQMSDINIEEEIINNQQELEKHIRYLAAREKIEALPAKYREVIALRFFAEKQISEIARILGKPEGTVKSLLHRGLEKLRKEMSDMKNSATFVSMQRYE